MFAHPVCSAPAVYAQPVLPSARGAFVMMAGDTATRVSMQLVIEGGGLEKERWCPASVVEVEGMQFVPVSRSDRALQRYVFGRGHSKDSNAPLASNVFLDELTKVRDRAVDATILQYLRDQDPLATLNAIPRTARQDIDAAFLPRTVQITIPAVELQTATESIVFERRQALCLLNMRRAGLIFIEATAENMAHVRAGVISMKDMHAQPRKRAAPMVDCGVKGIVADKRRKMLYTTWIDPEGKKKQRFTKKPAVWDNFNINVAAQELHVEKQDYIIQAEALCAARAVNCVEAQSAEDGGAPGGDADDEAEEAPHGHEHEDESDAHDIAPRADDASDAEDAQSDNDDANEAEEAAIDEGIGEGDAARPIEAFV